MTADHQTATTTHGTAEPAFQTEERSIPGPHGDIPVRLYLPTTPLPEPIGLVWCHGGAFVYGGLDTAESDTTAARLAEAGVAVVAVDYRLAPVPQWALDLGAEPGRGESHFPVASHEVDTVLAWADDALRPLSPQGWALGGASAGGALTAGAAVRLRDQGATAPSRLVLVCPLLHHSLPEASPELATRLEQMPPTAGIPLTPDVVDLITLNYVGNAPDVLHDPYAFPGGHDLTGLPPTLIIDCDIDTVRASGEAFATELASAGVDVESVVEPGTVHGHLDDPTLPSARRTADRIIAWLSR
ncbi:acetyl esterase/lipase [Rathayibacter sp. PhB151]|uniref:alpha/beta hydrolase fold domain-containing protein n=1 Tax=Rathayibacter sp. PhB151 TaxID=2485189 RepID=UPI00106366F3|nr:alpha/beta hydrolase fold domain-containing protein [Rathayibacter sp. PhB151]TDX79115.1 acetyl esterase/lipase [Rathayibacter sp. PhB151]